MVVVTHPLQHPLFDGSMTNKDFCNHCKWTGSGAIAFQPKSSAPETIEVKYGKVLQNYAEIQCWSKIKWGSETAHSVNRLVRNNNLRWCVIDRLLDKLALLFIF